MQLAYQLVAGTDERTKSLLDQGVTIIDPLTNPEGRERHLASIEQRTGAISSTDGQHIQHNSINGRTNHYRFDMNRDMASLVTLENQARMKVITEWKPHIMVDSHEMGALEGYLMDPPRQPLNPLFPKKNLYWREQYGFDQAAAFDAHGWSYYAKDWNVDFAPIYNASWVNFSGGAGILYEQAGVSSAAYKQETGHILTYREAVHHQLVSSLANLNTLKNNRQEILADYLADHIEAVNGDGALTGTPHRGVGHIPAVEVRHVSTPDRRVAGFNCAPTLRNLFRAEKEHQLNEPSFPRHFASPLHIVYDRVSARIGTGPPDCGRRSLSAPGTTTVEIQPWPSTTCPSRTSRPRQRRNRCCWWPAAT
jgi:hypothetical protein